KPTRAGIGVFRADPKNGIIVAESGFLPDIKLRAGVEDLQAAEQHEEQRNRPQPMRQPGPARLPIDQSPGFARRNLGNFSLGPGNGLHTFSPRSASSLPSYSPTTPETSQFRRTHEFLRRRERGSAAQADREIDG